MEFRSKERACIRQMYGIDSHVGECCLSKGRSACLLLNKEIRARLPSLSIAFDHYPGYVFVPTRLNVADDPTRARGIRTPRQPPPSWIKSLEKDIVGDFDYYAHLPTQRVKSSEWARLVVRLLLISGVQLQSCNFSHAAPPAAAASFTTGS
jgi:hypothetical protein